MSISADPIVPTSSGDTDRLSVLARVPGSVRADVCAIAGRKVVLVEFDESDPAPPLTSEMTMVMSAGITHAINEAIPFVLVVNSAGADVREGIAPLAGWGAVAAHMTRASGLIPMFAIVDGPAVSGPALLLGLADVVVMTEEAYAFVNGPMMVEQFTGVAIDKAELGSAAMMSSHAGVGAVVVRHRHDAIDAVGELLAYLPDNANVEPPRHDRHDPADRLCPELADVLPESSSGGYDVRRVAESIVDDGSLFEVRSGWATNVVTAFATIDGRPIGVIANQPIALAGTLDILASQKAARFVNTCDAFGLGLLTLVDTPGFYPGKDLEWRGMIRHGAQLVYAYGQATVPRVCVVLRKSYGGAYIVMDSKTMGNDVCLAWPWSELAVMGAGQAAAILRRGADPDETAAFIEDYSERLLNPYVAAERGFVDDVIEPHETRQRVAAAFEMLATKREALPRRRHGNSPL